MGELLRFGADARLSTSNGFTPLHFAALHPESNALNFLLERTFVDIDALDHNHGMSALALAVAKGDGEKARMLVRRGAKVGADVRIAAADTSDGAPEARTRRLALVQELDSLDDAHE